MDAPTSLRINLGDRSVPVFFDRLSILPVTLERHIGDVQRVLLVTDENVAALYLDAVRSSLTENGFSVDHFIMAAGEENKSLACLEKLYDWALTQGIRRHTPLVALGGGVVGDLAGFAAATLLRGVPLVQCPTTILAMVDSAIGGKTGINHTRGKNLIGAFHHPSFVLTDAATLETLPERERMSGLSEVVKHAVIADADLVQTLDSQWDSLLDPENDELASLVPRAAGIKAQFVSDDEREAGARAHLNFGHTFGHAIELAAGYGTLTHGEAVAIGMRAAVHLSACVGRAEPYPLGEPIPDTLQNADRLIARLQPPRLAPSITNQEIINAMASDKKRSKEGLRFIVLERTGVAGVAANVPADWVERSLVYARSMEPDTVT